MYNKRNDIELINKMFMPADVEPENIISRKNWNLLTVEGGSLDKYKPEGYDSEEVWESIELFYDQLKRTEEEVEESQGTGNEEGDSQSQSQDTPAPLPANPFASLMSKAFKKP